MKTLFVLVACVVFAFVYTYPNFYPGNSARLMDQTGVYCAFYYLTVIVAAVIHRLYETNDDQISRMQWTMSALVVVGIAADRDFIAWCLYLCVSVLLNKNNI